MLWAAPQFQKDGTIVPPVLSSESGGENFSGDFEYTGTRDYTGYCALPAAFRFRVARVHLHRDRSTAR